ncbi:MAG: hypothetical protein HY897_14605 [Deltaproteobacteria bacterium]|nr:hypothetical protein [Deltaproteobacteria bacterium]
MGGRKSQVVSALFPALLCSCSADVGLGEYEYACKSDGDCGPGYRCDAKRGCIKTTQAGDGGWDIGGKDVQGDAEELPDGSADGGDAYQPDGGRDAGGDVLLPDGGDAGPDGGGAYLLRMNSLYEGAAGACENEKYHLRSITGYSAGGAPQNGSYVLHRSMLFRR